MEVLYDNPFSFLYDVMLFSVNFGYTVCEFQTCTANCFPQNILPRTCTLIHHVQGRRIMIQQDLVTCTRMAAIQAPKLIKPLADRMGDSLKNQFNELLTTTSASAVACLIVVWTITCVLRILTADIWDTAMCDTFMHALLSYCVYQM